ncbi:MAG: oligosaccharide flippase family protein [Armatimonadetes bacterium]|nr:oligosaccharide flippase family protein [Armatimonadota bacterium]
MNGDRKQRFPLLRAARALLGEATDAAAYRSVAAQVKYPVGAMLAAQTVLTFGLTAVLSRLLGARAFGEYAVILTIAGIFRLFASFSVESGIPKFIAEARHEGIEQIKSYYAAGIWTRLAASFIALLAAGLLGPWLSRLYGVAGMASSVFVASIFLCLLGPLSFFFLSCIQGLERPVQWSTASLVSSLAIFPFAAVGAAGFARWGQLGMLVWIAGGWLLAVIVCAWFARRELGFLWARVDIARVRILIPFLFPLWIGGLVSFGAHTILKSYLAVTCGPVPVGQFEIGLTLLFHMGTFHQAFMIVFLPAWARRYAARDGAQLLRSFAQVRGVLAGIATAYGLVLALGGHWVVPAVFGPEQAGAIPTVRMMGIVMPLMIVSWVSSVTYVVGNRTGIVGRANLLWFCVVIPTGFLLIPSLGSFGAAVAFLLAYVAFTWYCVTRARPFFREAERWARQQEAR